VLAAFLFALPLVAPAHERDAGQADDRLVDKFTRFAGSKANAESLVNGLRNDQEVKLTSSTQGSATFTPKTDKMGFGNVNIALTLAKATLAEQGITRPTPQQIEAALNGGTVTNRAGKEVKLTGILTQRASGMGWGKIAQANGFKLGELMRHTATSGTTAITPSSSTTRIITGPRFHKVRFERHDRPHRVERVGASGECRARRASGAPERGRRG
jgi:hypothetical protein